MDMMQLYQQIQRIQQEVNDINHVCTQLQQSEQANAFQLQQMTQKELVASEGLKRIQRTANQLFQDINQISNITRQITSQVSPYASTTNMPGTYSPLSGLSGLNTGTGSFGGNTYGSVPTNNAGLSQTSPLSNAYSSAFSSTLPTFNQGYIPSQFSNANLPGYASQAFSNAMPSQFDITAHNNNLGLSSSSMINPMLSSGLSTTSNFSNIGLSSGMTGYSPYQSLGSR